MLKINKVYLYDDIDYIYVHDRKRVRKRLIYTVSSISSVGKLLTKRKIKYRRGYFVEQKKFKVEMRILVPRVDKDKILFETLVKQANTKIDLVIAVTDKKEKKDLLNEIGRMGHACVGLVNKQTNEFYTVRDFARAIKIKSFVKTYQIIEQYLKTIYVPSRYRHRIQDAADTTIVSCLRNYATTWNALHGFSKRIDAMLEKDLTAYQKELNERKLSL